MALMGEERVVMAPMSAGLQGSRAQRRIGTSFQPPHGQCRLVCWVAVGMGGASKSALAGSAIGGCGEICSEVEVKRASRQRERCGGAYTLTAAENF
jgi:hypothetical protein